LSPTHADGWFVLGNTLYQIGALSQAELSYQECLRLNPMNSRAKQNLNMLMADIQAAA
jgi:cytochrome c-type biogenesis protein CcmH/NrfG